VATARRLGIPEERWVYPVAGVESNAMVALSARARLDTPPGVREVARAVYEHTGLTAAGLDLIDLYSCFPVAVELYAEALGLEDGRPLTVTGGMPWAGGPYNNYVLQATCRMATLIRAGRGATGLVTCVSGPLTKHGVAVWSARPPTAPARTVDLTAQVGATAEMLDVVDDHTGPGRVAGYTVLAGGADRPRAVAVLDLPDGRRTVAVSEDPATVASMQTKEWMRRPIEVKDGQLVP
jgi:acetyl-CoA C-acetyltransferase